MGKTKVVGKDVKLKLEEFAKTRSKHRGVKKKGPDEVVRTSENRNTPNDSRRAPVTEFPEEKC